MNGEKESVKYRSRIDIIGSAEGNRLMAWPLYNSRSSRFLARLGCQLVRGIIIQNFNLTGITGSLVEGSRLNSQGSL